MGTPDHVENTGENLRRAAEVTHEPGHEKDDSEPTPEDLSPLPDFNS
jgi:hypothetical protein